MILKTTTGGTYSGFWCVSSSGSRNFGIFGDSGTAIGAFANTLTLRSISGVEYCRFSLTGGYTISTTSQSLFTDFRGTASTPSLLYINQPTLTVTIGGTTGSGMLSVINASAAKIALSIKQASSQSSDTVQFADSSGSPATRFDNTFKFTNRRGLAAVATVYAGGGETSFNTTAIGNVGTGEDNLRSYSIAANEFGVNGDSLVFKAGGTFDADASATKRLRVRLASNLMFDSGAVVVAAATPWRIEGHLIRNSSSTVEYAISMIVGNMTLGFTYASRGQVTGLTLSSSNSLQFTGECSAATNNQVVQNSLLTYWYGAN
jgi:hypothetical protein